MESARVIITYKCSRNCSYCVNKHKPIRDAATHIQDLSEIPHRNEINITGGEPMDDPARTFGVLASASALGFKTIYLYTAKWHICLPTMVVGVNGLHFTLHADATAEDVAGFHEVQQIACLYPNKSFRLALDPRLQTPLTLIPRAWTEVWMKYWRDESDICIPEHETLYVLGEQS